jgi:hypothetical protein
MRLIVAGLLLLVSQFAFGATLVSTLTPPTKVGGKLVKATGPTSLRYVRVQYGTCDGDQFGIWEGGKTVRMPATEIRFEDLPYRRTCTRAQWQLKSGAWTEPTLVSVAVAL